MENSFKAALKAGRGDRIMAGAESSYSISYWRSRIRLVIDRR